MSRSLLHRSLAACILLSTVPAASAATWSGSAALTSDYVFRGISQTLGDPAAQMGLRVQADSGAYAAVWGSTVEFAGDTGASSEIDYVAGWSGALGERWALDVGVTWFDYPAARADLDYAELVATATWNDRAWVTLGYSRDVFATDATGIYAQVGMRVPLRTTLRLDAAAGYYRLDDAYGDDYAHAQLGLAWTVRAPIELRLTAHATDRGAKTLFPGLAGSRLEASVAASF